MKPTSKRTPLIVLSGLAVSLLLAALPAFAATMSEDEADTSATTTEEPVTISEPTDGEEDGAALERPRRRVEVLKSNASADAANERQAAMEQRREDISTNQAERRAALTERAQARIMNLAANISNRMEAALRRLENISERMNTRLDLLAERGITVDTARTQLQVAETEIASAYQTLTDIDTQVTNAITSENPRQSWEAVRTTYASARDDIRTAHQALREVITLTKRAIDAEASDINPTVTE